jgi:hypothetical protein
MPKSLNSFILTDNIIDVMKQKLKKTEDIHREFGFNLCHVEGSNELKDDTHCIGKECSIQLEKTCKTGTKVGTFHTHPRADSSPSLPDLLGGYYYGIECIGGIADKKIVCYVRKDKERNLETNKIFSTNTKRFKSLSTEIAHNITKQRGYKIHMAKLRDLWYTRDFLKKKYFDTINISE